MRRGSKFKKPEKQVQDLFIQTGDKEHDQRTLEQLHHWIEYSAKFGPHDNNFFNALKRAMLEHPDPWARFLSLRAITKYPVRDDVVELLIRCVSEFHIEIGDIYFPFEALSHLEQFRPLEFEQYDTIRKTLVRMFQTQSAFEFFSYNGYLTPFENFRRLVPEPEYTILWPEFVRDLASGCPILFTRVLTTLLPYGQIFNDLKYIEHTIQSEHLESAKLMRVYLLHNIAQCEACLLEKETKNDSDDSQSVIKLLSHCYELLDTATTEELRDAQLAYRELLSKHEIDEYFEHASPFCELVDP